MRFDARPDGPVARAVHRFDSAAVHAQTAIASAVFRLTRPDAGSAEAQPYVVGETRIGRELRRPALLGFLASVAIFFGVTQSDSPFTKKVVGAWFFGIPPAQPAGITPPPGQWVFLGIVAVWGGMILMFRAWADTVKVTTRHPGLPLRSLWPIFVAWVLPLMVLSPFFSNDAYSYAAQGELFSRGFNPYHYGPALLNGTSFWLHTDAMWRNVGSPYGPLFLWVDKWIVIATGHNALAAVEILRVLMLGGTALIGLAVPVLARHFGKDGATAFALAALNPIVLLHFVGGVHNDALMVGLLVAGYACAKRGNTVVGLVLCGLAASVKVTALVGVAFIGWTWLGPDRSPRERIRPTVTALLLSGGVMAALSEATGLGWGWIAGLSNPDTVISWLDPMTGVAMLASKAASLVGLGGHQHLFITLARGAGLLGAGAIACWLLWRSERMGELRALGVAFLAIVLLSPVVQPWYVCWALVVLAPVAERATRRLLVGASVVFCFAGMPGGSQFVGEFEVANPWLVALFAGALVLLCAFVLLPRVRGRSRAAAASAFHALGVTLPELEVAEAE